MSDSKPNLGWFDALAKRLPLSKQTRAQTANHIFDALALVGFIFFSFKYDEPLLSFIALMTTIILSFICVMATKPKA